MPKDRIGPQVLRVRPPIVRIYHNRQETEPGVLLLLVGELLYSTRLERHTRDVAICQAQARARALAPDHVDSQNSVRLSR